MAATEALTLTVPLVCWRGDRGTYHLVKIEGDWAATIAMHARLLKLELGTKRGFGSVKVMARIGGTAWKSSVFPQDNSTEWILLVAKKVMQAEDLAEGDPIELELDLL